MITLYVVGEYLLLMATPTDLWRELAGRVISRLPWVRDEAKTMQAANPHLRSTEGYFPRTLRGESGSLTLEISVKADRDFARTGTVEISASTDFRGAPPGRERDRALPWLYLGPVPARPGAAFSTSDGNDVLARYQLARGTFFSQRPPTFALPGVEHSIAAVASYPPAEQRLRQPDWMSRYARWELLTKRNGHTDFPPLLIGRTPSLTLVFSLVVTQPMDAYANLLVEFLQVTDMIEAAFDSPILAQVPWPFTIVQKPAPTGFVGTHPAIIRYFRCPKCGNQETAVGFGGLPTNFLSKQCRAAIYAGPPG